MRLVELAVESFRGFRAPYRLVLDQPGLVLVEGENRDGGSVTDSNGSGKSMAVVEALVWGLYGRMVRYGGKTATDEAVHPQRGADVTVTLRRGGGLVTVRRRRSPKGSPSLEVALDGKPYQLSRDTGRRAEEVAALFGFDYNTFRSAVVVQGGDSAARAGYAAQMALIESLLRLDELGVAADLARRESTTLDRELSGLRVEERLRAEEADRAQERLARLQAAPLVDYAAERARLEEAIQQAKWAEGVIPGLRQVVEGAEAERRRASTAEGAASGEVSTQTRLAEQMTKALETRVCPTCNRPLSEGPSATERQELERRKAEALKRQASARTALAKAHGVTVKAEQKIATMRSELADKQHLAAGRAGAEAALGALDREAAQRAEQLAEVEEEQARAQQAFVGVRARVLALTPRHQRALFWAAGYGRDGLQAELFQQAMPVLNRAAERYSEALTGGAITVRFDPSRASAREDLLRIGGASAPTYDGLSRGEKERVDLVLALSLRELARWRLPEPINAAIFDETFDHVDVSGLREVSRLLQAEAAAGATIYVVTHNPSLKALFPSARCVRVVREGGEAEVNVD